MIQEMFNVLLIAVGIVSIISFFVWLDDRVGM
jgi:hypothetical protein